jgi:serine/threonine protein kinase
MLEFSGSNRALFSRAFYTVAFEKSELGASDNAFQFLTACYCAQSSSAFTVSVERSDFGALAADINIGQEMNSLGLGRLSDVVIANHNNAAVYSSDLMFTNAECSFFGNQFNIFVCLHLRLNDSASSFTLVSINYALVPVSGDLLSVSVKFAYPSDSIVGLLEAGCEISYDAILHLGTKGLKAFFDWNEGSHQSQIILQFPTSRFLCVDFFASSASITAADEKMIANVFFTSAPVPTFAQFMGLTSKKYFLKCRPFLSLPLEMQMSMCDFRKICTPATLRTMDFALSGAILASNQSKNLQLGNFLTWHSFEIDRVDVTFIDNVIKSFSAAKIFAQDFQTLFTLWYKTGRCAESHRQINIHSMYFWYEKFKVIFNYCRSELRFLADRCIMFQMRMQEMQKLTSFSDVTGYIEYLRTCYSVISADAVPFEQEQPLDDAELKLLELRWFRNVDIKRLIELSESQKKLTSMLPRFPYDGKFISSVWDETTGRDPRKDAFIAYCSAGVNQTNVVSFFDGLAARRDRRVESVIKYILESHYNLRDITMIGQGGEACVFKCRHGDSKIYQAAKVFAQANQNSSEKERDPQFYKKNNRKRVREARKIQLCKQHSGIVKINDVFCSGDPVVILMEYLDGLPLNRFIEKWVRGSLPDNLRGPESPEYTEESSMYLHVVFDFVRQICDSVSFIHKNGITHADLSFGNVMVERREGQKYSWATKIIDFGLAKVDANVVSELSVTDVTQSAAVKGTPFFMSPERKNGKSATNSDDVWSVGVMFFMMIFQHPDSCHTGWCLEYRKCFFEDADNVVNLIDVRKLRDAAKRICYCRNDSRFMSFFEVCIGVFFDVNPSRFDLDSTNDRLADADCLLSALEKADCQSVYDVCFLSDDESRIQVIEDLKQRLERQKIGNRNIRCIVLSLSDGLIVNSIGILDSLIFVPLMTIPESLQNDEFYTLLQLSCIFCKRPQVGINPRFGGAVRLWRIVPVLFGFDQVTSLNCQTSTWPAHQTSTLSNLIVALTGRYARDEACGIEPKLKISDRYMNEIKQNPNTFQILCDHAPDVTIQELVVVPDVDSGRHRMMRISMLISSQVTGYWNELMGFDDVVNPIHLSHDDTFCQDYSTRSEAVRFNTALWLGRFHFILCMCFYCWIYNAFSNLGLLRCVWKFDGASSSIANSSFAYQFTLLVNTSTNIMIQKRRHVDDSAYYVHSRQCWVTAGLGDEEHGGFPGACDLRYMDRPKDPNFADYCVSFEDADLFTQYLNQDGFEQVYFVKNVSPRVNCSLSPLVQNFFNVTELLCPIHNVLDRVFFTRWVIAVATIIIYFYKQRSQQFTSSDDKNRMIHACGRYSVASQGFHSMCGFLCIVYLMRLDDAVKLIHPDVPVLIEHEAHRSWVFLEFISSLCFTFIFKILKDFLLRLESKEKMKNCVVIKMCKYLGISCLSPNDGFDFETSSSISQGGVRSFFNRICHVCYRGFIPNQYELLRPEDEEIELEMSGGRV